MKRQDFYFELPQSLIAQKPLPHRTQSKLLVYDKQQETYAHHQFADLLSFLRPGDLLVFNNTKVMRARLYGHKSTGGKVELLIERLLTPTSFWAQIRASKGLRPGAQIELEQGFVVTVLDKQGVMHLCRTEIDIEHIMSTIGHIPLPPYITRADDAEDGARYQTVYAETPGSVAAPTAGLHFDARLMTALQQAQVKVAYTTLHVGAGTFMPVRVDNIHEHVMHTEYYTITEDLAQSIAHTKAAGHRVIAVGTTTLRSLESAACTGVLHTGAQSTNIFITPGFTFQICDGLITNFHLPESTLLMLVCAFIGYEAAMSLYHQAIAQEYRFFSYGDACLLL